ncbi:MAG: hypothetical protein ABI852_11275 [Gemmatimonadaceae bacterium]
MSLLGSLLAACTGASAQWSRQTLVEHDLDGIARVALPKEYVAMTERTERTPDYNTYLFRKTYKTHINGQTSYAEEMSVIVVAPDFPRARFDEELANGKIVWFGKAPGTGDAGEKGLRWKVREVVYERHPVTEPSWNIRVDNRERGLVIVWRGFKKQYTLEEAKKNLAGLVDRMTVSNTLAADFAKRRSWKGNDWEQAFATNLRVAKVVLAEKQLSLVQTDSLASKGLWRFYVDNERPQQLHVIHELVTMAMPDGPFRLTAPVTYYKYMQERWFQENQGQESDMLPEKGQAAIAWNFTDRAKVYFFQMKAVDLWKTYASEKEFGDMLRNVLRTMEADHTRLLRDGFIRGDAEP